MTNLGKNRAKVVLVEDDAFIAEAWQDLLQDDVDFFWFDRPSAFQDFVARDPGFVAGVALIIMDHNFDTEPSIKGLDFAKALVRSEQAPPVVMCSSEMFSPADLVGGIAAAIAKEPRTWVGLSCYSRPA